MDGVCTVKHLEILPFKEAAKGGGPDREGLQNKTVGPGDTPLSCFKAGILSCVSCYRSKWLKHKPSLQLPLCLFSPCYTEYLVIYTAI